MLVLTIIVFFPNNDVAPSRGFRIRKAMEWGATWIKEWRGSITHVIVDKELCHKDLLNFLKVDALPVSDQNSSTRGLEWMLIVVGQRRPGQRNVSD